MSDSIFLTDGNGVLTGLVDTDYTGELVIPEYVAGERIISIGTTALWDCYFTSITIPDSVTSIGDGAFYDCIDLASIYMPDSIISIGEHAFYGCNSLTSVTIPDSVTSIGNNAFEYCLGLTSINIPNGVTNISEYTFYGCSNLTSITIPNNVTSIENGAFYDCSNLTSITIPNSVTSIGNGAFYGCNSLTSVTIPDSVTSIGKDAFYGCSRLTSVYVPDPNNLSTAVSSYDWTDTCSSNITFLQDPAYIDYLIKGGSLISLADKIRVLSGSDEKMGLDEMIESVGSHRCPTVAELTASGDATAADIAAGKKAWVDGVEVVGELVPPNVVYGTLSKPTYNSGLGGYVHYLPGLTNDKNFVIYALGTSTSGSSSNALAALWRIDGTLKASRSMAYDGSGITEFTDPLSASGETVVVKSNTYFRCNVGYVVW